MDNISGNKRVDEDILRCKEEILRLKGAGSPQSRQPKPSSSFADEKNRSSRIAPKAADTPVEKKNDPRPLFEGDGLSDTAAFSDTASFSSPRYDERQFDKYLEGGSGGSGILAALEQQVASEEAETESEIPEFNLAEQIMAEHRKAVSNRRKSPANQKEQADSRPAEVVTAAPISIKAIEAPMSPQQKVIADIVAKDIAQYYKGRNLY